MIQVAKGVQRCLIATWSERGVVNVWDTSRHKILLDSPNVGGASSSSSHLRGHNETPLFTFTGHTVTVL